MLGWILGWEGRKIGEECSPAQGEPEAGVIPAWKHRMSEIVQGLGPFYATCLVNVFRMSKCLGTLQAEEDRPRTKEGSFGDILTVGLTSKKVHDVI